jgi:hypothetical protein
LDETAPFLSYCEWEAWTDLFQSDLFILIYRTGFARKRLTAKHPWNRSGGFPTEMVRYRFGRRVDMNVTDMKSRSFHFG